MQIVKTDVPVQVLLVAARHKDRARATTRTARVRINPDQHREMGPDGVYYIFVAHDPETGEGGYCIVLRAHVLAEAYPRVGDIVVAPPWTAIYNLAMDAGAIETRIAPMQHPQGGETHRHT